MNQSISHRDAEIFYWVGNRTSGDVFISEISILKQFAQPSRIPFVVWIRKKLVFWSLDRLINTGFLQARSTYMDDIGSITVEELRRGPDWVVGYRA